MKLEQLNSNQWRIPKSSMNGMRVDGILFVSKALLASQQQDQSPQQVANVATLPGIVASSLAMPDMHWGYGFPIGGVAAFDKDEGIISPGGVGYDINCGVNLTRTSFTDKDIMPKLTQLVDRMFDIIPAGLGRGGGVKISAKEFDKVITRGAGWAAERGLATQTDLEHMEENGCLAGADPTQASQRCRERGFDQIGTLGAGNHFVEIQIVEKIFDEQVASAFGLFPHQICIMVHSGSRGFGYQICTESLPMMNKAAGKYGIELPDRQLACAPLQSEEGRRYFAAMKCAANYAWANRLCLRRGAMHAVMDILSATEQSCGFGMVYDVSHNIAKMERHLVDGKQQEVCVHRKGATRSLPKGHPLVPQAYRHVGQPVLIPGDMGRASWVLVGAEGALTESFGSAPHGAGRLLSRKQGSKLGRGEAVRESLAARGIIVQARSQLTLAEEQPGVYKDVDEVVRVAEAAGLARPVARLRPLGCIKG
ncbi:RtcB family protein [bacterium]|nr:RtcB family protein [bacterium]